LLLLFLLLQLPQSTLDSLLPLFERLTPQQLAVMRKAVTTLPPQSVAKLTQMVQASGPLANIVAAKAQFLPSIRIVDNKFANTPASPPDTKKIAAEFYGKRDSKCPNKTVCSEEDAGLRVRYCHQQSRSQMLAKASYMVHVYVAALGNIHLPCILFCIWWYCLPQARALGCRESLHAPLHFGLAPMLSCFACPCRLWMRWAP
jgi:hypothetical protein